VIVWDCPKAIIFWKKMPEEMRREFPHSFLIKLNFVLFFLVSFLKFAFTIRINLAPNSSLFSLLLRSIS
jgi:membrane-bound metal-dependent hydrolase YbcI (DUF457 family)